MTRQQAIEDAADQLRSGRYLEILGRRVAIPSVSQDPRHSEDLLRYHREIMAAVEPLGFECQILPNPVTATAPILVGRYVEDAQLPTLLIYGHGDVVPGLEPSWTQGRKPFELRQEGERVYGRGTADNKGQHTLVLMALESVKAVKGGRLGFNVTLLIDVCEEIGSKGLLEFCREHRELLKADILIGSDGPRLSIDQPTMYLGTRGIYSFDLVCELRDRGHHSGNWGGLIANPAVLLSHAVASLVDGNGRISVRGVLPPSIPETVREALHGLSIDPGAQGLTTDPWWGEPGLTQAERALGWNALEVLTLSAGVQVKPVNAIPPKAVAHCHIRYTVDRDPNEFLPAIQQHLRENGHTRVQAIEAQSRASTLATRLDPGHKAALWARQSLTQTLGRSPAVVPNGGGSLPNECFALELAMPTIWVSHSYPGCGQHAGDEHIVLPVIEQGLKMMAGLFWDLEDYFIAS